MKVDGLFGNAQDLADFPRCFADSALTEAIAFPLRQDRWGRRRGFLGLGQP